MNKAFKFRLYPNKEQQILIVKTFGCVRFIYNKMLEDKINYYKEYKSMLNNTPAQYKQKFEWLKEVDSLALANVQQNLNKAYSNFFRDKKIGFPKFKSKKHSKDSYTTNNQKGTISIIDNNHIKIPKVGTIKFKQHRIVPGDYVIKSATISKSKTDKYYISILTEYEYEIPKLELDKDNSIGLDYSSPNFYVDNQGIKADYPKFYRLSENKLAKEQQKLSHMKFGSNNYLKQKLKVAKVHEKISNQRKDWLHKLSTRLSNRFDYICIEDLNMKNMSQGLHLGKSTMDNGFGMFKEMLTYKLLLKGKQLVKIDKWFPSSKMCNHCGTINNNLTLSDRTWVCECGNIINRDTNAALNIKQMGLSLV